MLATGRGTHIGIDILGKAFENRGYKKAQMIVGRIISLTAVLTLVWLTKSSIDFVIIEFEFGKPASFGIHTGFLVAIIPFGFSLIGYRFFYRFLFPPTPEPK